MYVNVTRQNDLDYLLEVLEEKGYQWIDGGRPSSLSEISSVLLHDGITLSISTIRHIIAGSYRDADTGFNEVFDLI